jgi:GDP-4-dehydro-6-deoxy-D-mannose reductase
MRALVTGATGFVGGHLIEHLSDMGDVIIGLSNTAQWPAPLHFMERIARLEQVDLADGDQESELIELIDRKQPEAIYHLAAQANPQASLDDVRGTWALNLGGTLNLLEAVRHSRCRPWVLLVSSGVVYGNPDPEDLPVGERCPLRPNNPYAASKAAADLLGIQHYLAYGTPVIIARPFNHAGPRQSSVYVLSALARQVAEVEVGARSCVEVGNLQVVRDFTDVRDIVRAYRLLIERGAPGEIYHIGTGRDLTLSQLLDMIVKCARIPVEVRVDPARIRAVDSPRLLCNASKMHAATGWSPRIPIEKTLSDMLDYWRTEITHPTRQEA